MKQKIVVISGPTAVGKSDYAVKIAKQINGEIIGADSMQIYKNLNIGTGKISESEKQGVTHHLIDIIEPDEEYSVSDFMSDCKSAIDKISANNKIPVIVGGTGLYLNALINGFSLAQTPKDENLRESLKKRLDEEGAETLHKELQSIDSESANKISVNDAKRIIRALEIYYVSGKTKSESATRSECVYDYCFVVLNSDRKNLYERINRRVDSMISSGLVEEVRILYKYKDCNSMKAIGYKEIIEYLDGRISLDDAVEQIKQNSRHYAKRQITYLKWLGADKLWVDISELAKADEMIAKHSTMCDIIL